MDGSSESDRASGEEERALLAICGYLAVGEADRLAKARYLLEIEARDELDLGVYMQAVLRSTMWRGSGDRGAVGPLNGWYAPGLPSFRMPGIAPGTGHSPELSGST